MKTGMDQKYVQGLRVINIGLQGFYDALVQQGCKAVQLEWRPPVKQSKEVQEILDALL